MLFVAATGRRSVGVSIGSCVGHGAVVVEVLVRLVLNIVTCCLVVLEREEGKRQKNS